MANSQPKQEADGIGDQVAGDLARTLDEAARGLIERGEEGVEHTLELIVRGAIDTVPHVEQAGVSLVERRGTVESHAPSSEVVRDLDRLQSELQEGPCLDAIWHEQRTLIQDMAAASERWSRWAPAAAERGIQSLISFQLFANTGSAGALNMYSGTAKVFDDDTAEIGALFASQAALVLHGAQRMAGLNIALSSRDVIGQAKGILMERFDLGQDQAFAMLVRSSQHTNMKLVDVATWLAEEKEKNRKRRP
ncbi:GAF and ANTAR domain-containing protein [Actinomycetospora sp. CA-101289]|uniref:GAF and ANTAR domain-containing protein n=1 Tax=Actinomycetospora sp. CA-101289 TaxID=3239893 RepID=UPI003D999C53